MSALQNVAVLVTRPVQQAQSLCDALSDVGAIPIRFPTIAIEPLAAIDQLHADVIIFTSANAVAYGLDDGTHLAGTIIAIGPGTQKTLQKKGFSCAVPNAPYQSESVLAMPELADVTGKKIAIVAGVGGREMLYDELTARGANVTKFEVYRRVKPPVDEQVLLNFWQQSARVATVTSVEALDNLFELVPIQDHHMLMQTLLLVIGERQAKAAREKSFQRIIVSDNVEGMISALYRASPLF